MQSRECTGEQVAWHWLYICVQFMCAALCLPRHNFIDRLTEMSNSSPVTGLEWPRGLQEIKVPRFHDNVTGWW